MTKYFYPQIPLLEYLEDPSRAFALAELYGQIHIINSDEGVLAVIKRKTSINNTSSYSRCKRL